MREAKGLRYAPAALAMPEGARLEVNLSRIAKFITKHASGEAVMFLVTINRRRLRWQPKA